MQRDELIVVTKHDYKASSSENAYRGKYTVGRFHLTDAFIVEYMKLTHGIEIPISWVSNSFLNIPDTDTQKVIYMESCDILSKHIINELRNAVKSPPVNMKIYRNGNHLTKLEFIREKN